MMTTTKSSSDLQLGPTSKRFFAFLDREGVLETFVEQCRDIVGLAEHVNRRPLSAWQERHGGLTGVPQKSNQIFGTMSTKSG